MYSDSVLKNYITNDGPQGISGPLGPKGQYGPVGKRMSAEQFVYWLNGYLEIENPKSIDEIRTQIIKEHINLIFDNVAAWKYHQAMAGPIGPVGPC